MGPEAKLYKKLRKVSKDISWIRIENLSALGTPDLLGYNTLGHFFTVELKVTKGNKVRFSPHQIAFHKTHPNNTFILVEALGQRSSKLVQYFLIPGSRIDELVACGLRPQLDACCLELEACGLELSKLGVDDRFSFWLGA